MSLLNIQLKLLPSLLKIDRAYANLTTIFEKVKSLSAAKGSIISEILKLIKLILLALAEKMKEIVQRLRVLQSTMGEKRFGGLTVMYVHKDATDLIDVIETEYRPDNSLKCSWFFFWRGGVRPK